MRELTRREFIGGCLTLALAGYLPSVFLKAGGEGKGSPLRPDKSNSAEGFIPGYARLHRSGELRKRGERLWDMMRDCRLCPRECGVNRIDGAKGFCGASARLIVSSAHPHFGEERPLVGKGGSGTVFFSHCSLRCVFCINWQISHGGEGSRTSLEELAGMMLRLQERGCRNINVVTPTHYSPHILMALDIAASQGLALPLVWNTCGWEKVEVLKMLDGIVDIYLPDFKYSSGTMAKKYSGGADTYPRIAKDALLEMNRQVGVAQPESGGLITSGLMIRHLVMPNNVSGTREVLFWIAENLPKNTYVNIMSQYRPMYQANEYPKIARRLYISEYRQAVEWAREAGLTNLNIQG